MPTFLLTIGEPILRAFYVSLIHGKAPVGYVFATSSFTQQALNFVEDKPIELLDLERLIRMDTTLMSEMGV